MAESPEPPPLIVGVGLTRESEYVLRKVAALAGDPARLLAVHVVENRAQIPLTDGGAAAVDDTPPEDLTQLAEANLQALCHRVGVSRWIVMHGEPAEELHNIAHELGAPIVAIGTHGHRRWRALLGETANAVLHGTRASVLAVLSHHETGDVHNAYRNVLVAVDLSQEADEVVAAAARVAERFDAALGLVTVVKPASQTYAALDMDAMAHVSLEFERTVEQQAWSHLEALKARHGASDVTVRRGDVRHEIHALARERGADLIVLGTHGTEGLALLLGSTPDAVLAGVPCDVLAVRVGLTRAPADADPLVALRKRWDELHGEEAELLDTLTRRPDGDPLWEQYRRAGEEKAQVVERMRALRAAPDE